MSPSRPLAAGLGLFASWAVVCSIALLGGCKTDVPLGGYTRSNVIATDAGAPPDCVDAPCGTPCVLAGCADNSCTTANGFCNADHMCQQTTPNCQTSCVGLPCGADCTESVCDPNGTCFNLKGQCDDSGICSSAPFTCNPCVNAPCGQPCVGCDPNIAPDCPVASWVCDGYGTCTDLNTFSCDPSWAPCLAGGCGDPCTFCRPGDSGCIEPKEPLFCDAFNRCVEPQNALSTCMPGPCESQLCGTGCCSTMNAPGCVNSPGPGICDANGSCRTDFTMSPPSCTCDPQTCGMPCDPCGPTDKACIESEASMMTPVPHSCDAVGYCRATAPACM